MKTYPLPDEMKLAEIIYDFWRRYAICDNTTVIWGSVVRDIISYDGKRMRDKFHSSVARYALPRHIYTIPDHIYMNINRDVARYFVQWATELCWGDLVPMYDYAVTDFIERNKKFSLAYDIECDLEQDTALLWWCVDVASACGISNFDFEIALKSDDTIPF